jgi:hypothetical protein
MDARMTVSYERNMKQQALIGGLTSSMLLTLVVVPVVYVIIDRIKDRFSGEEEERMAKMGGNDELANTPLNLA